MCSITLPPFWFAPLPFSSSRPRRREAPQRKTGPSRSRTLSGRRAQTTRRARRPSRSARPTATNPISFRALREQLHLRLPAHRLPDRVEHRLDRLVHPAPRHPLDLRLLDVNLVDAYAPGEVARLEARVADEDRFQRPVPDAVEAVPVPV